MNEAKRQHADALIEAILGDLRSEAFTLEIPNAEEFQRTARHFLYVVEGPGPDSQEPGSFTTLLIQATMRADRENLRLLARVYPAIASIVTVYKFNPDGQRIVQAMSHLLD